MKSIYEAIAAQTPKVFAKIAALSVALGVVSVGILEAPYEIRESLPQEIFQAAKYVAVMSWGLNLFSIAQKEYDKKENDETSKSN